MAAFDLALTSCASGRVRIDRFTTMQPNQSIMGEIYILPAGTRNAVMSPSQFSDGALSQKSHMRRFPGAGLSSPMHEPYRRCLRALATGPG